VKRWIGIDITEDRVSAVQLCRSGGKLSLERVGVQQIPSDTSSQQDSAPDLQTAIRALVKQEGFEPRATVAAAMPSGRVFFHNFRTDLSNKQDLPKLLKFELEDDFPIRFDELVVGVCSRQERNEHEHQLLVAAVSRSELRDRTKILTEAGLKCSVVTADACALHAAAALNQDLAGKAPFLIIYIDACRTILAISENNKLTYVRYLNHHDFAAASGTSAVTASALMREIELTARAASEHGDLQASKILIAGNSEVAARLSEELAKESTCEIAILNPYSQIGRPPEPHAEDELTIAVGLALMGAHKSSDMLDFLAVDALKVDEREKTKRSALVSGVLLAAIVAVLLANLFIQLATLKNERQRIKQQIRQVFVQTLPEEQKIVKELAQLTEQLDKLRAEYTTLTTALGQTASPLRILQRISEEITPGQNISVSRISVTGESVALDGTAESFESVDNLISTLRRISEFDRIEPQDIDLDTGSGSVRFSLEIALASE
jgi:type II secretion system protein L